MTTDGPVIDSMPAGASAEHAIADGAVHQLDPRSITLARLKNTVRNSAAAALLALAFALLWLEAALPAGGEVGLAALWMLLSALLGWHAWSWPRLEYRHASYRVDADEVEIRRGVLWRTVINVPRSRVQHTDVSQGPWQRRFGLATLALYTAGTAHAKVSLPGLAHERALLIREHLLPRGTTDVV